MLRSSTFHFPLSIFYFIFSKFCLFILFSTFYFLFSLSVQAAGFYFGAHSREVAVGETVEVGVFLTTDNATVNAVEGNISIPTDLVTVKEIRDGGTIVNLWVERPELKSSKVRFAGIIPGGYHGGQGYLFSLLLIPRAAGEAHIITTREQILLHDGVGTAAPIRRGPLTLSVKDSGIIPERFVPVEDREPPESFTVEIVSDPNLFDGQWFLVFATQDKGSGIDHYEVRENRKWKIENGKWKVVESPYVLRDQTLRSYVYVKAVDKAGNVREAMHPPPHPQTWYERPMIWGILILCVFFLLVWRWRRQRR